MADNFTAGYTFDGETGLKTGADLEDLVTQARFTEAAFAGDANSLFDGDTITRDADGNAKVGDGSIGTTQLEDGSVTSDKLASAVQTAISDLESTVAGLTSIPTAANAYAFCAFRNGSFNVTSSWAKVSLDAELYDYGSAFSGGRFTAPVAGLYTFFGLVRKAKSDSGVVSAIYVNGVLAVTGTYGGYQDSSQTTRGSCVAMTRYLTAGQYVELYALDMASSTAGVTGSANTYLEGRLVATV